MQLLSGLSAQERIQAKERSVGSRLPYACHIDDRTLRTKDGLLMQFIHLGGLLFETADTEELNYRKDLRDAVLQAIGSSRFAIYHHIIRRRVDAVPEASFDDPFSARLDAAWRARLEAVRSTR